MLCLAEFASYSFKDYIYHEYNEIYDAQPDVLTDSVAETQHTVRGSAAKFPNKRRLININEITKCIKIGAVIRFHTPNKHKNPKRFFITCLCYVFLCEMNF